MKYPVILNLLASFALAGSCGGTPPTPSFIKPLLTAEIPLSPALGPIPVPAGFRLVEPIREGGRISGAINGSIISGTIAPIVFDNPATNPNFTSDADTYLYGIIDPAEDGSPGGFFYVHAVSIGKAARSVARLLIEATGEYAYLQEEFIFAQIVSDTSASLVTLEAYQVERP